MSSFSLYRYISSNLKDDGSSSNNVVGGGDGGGGVGARGSFYKSFVKLY